MPEEDTAMGQMICSCSSQLLTGRRAAAEDALRSCFNSFVIVSVIFQILFVFTDLFRVHENMHEPVADPFFAVWNEPAVFARRDLRGDTAHIGGDDRHAEDQRFKNGIGKPFIMGKEGENIGFADERIRIVQRAEQPTRSAMRL